MDLSFISVLLWKIVNILVVDDNDDITGLLNDLLESGGYDVTPVNNGKDALDLILKETFDVILLDVTMPEFSGLDVIKSLKNSGDLEKNKVILFTAASIADQEIQDWIKMGVKDCLRKPFDPGMLFESISNVTIQS